MQEMAANSNVKWLLWCLLFLLLSISGTIAQEDFSIVERYPERDEVMH